MLHDALFDQAVAFFLERFKKFFAVGNVGDVDLFDAPPARKAQRFVENAVVAVW